jgi:8-oxo-dGTP pyrophosphatase MutT (NUDIX family)
MYIKIYFNDRPLFLCDSIDETIEPYIHHDDAVYIDELDLHTVKSMIHEMEQSSVHAGVFLHNDLEELKKSFFKKFTLLKAGGGLVVNDKGEVLLIFRRGKWDLPKGKLDKRETIEECALREVKEETGLKEVELVSPIGITYHTYHEGTKHILKESHWFRMKAEGNQTLIPQTSEDIQKILWADKKQLKESMKNMFPSVKDVLLKLETSLLL